MPKYRISIRIEKVSKEGNVIAVQTDSLDVGEKGKCKLMGLVEFLQQK